MTRPRRAILEELRTQELSHPTADEVYEAVRRRLPRISLGTVYRNLEALSEAGLVLKLELAAAQKRFDITTSKHYHVRCVECGRVDDCVLDLPLDLERALRSSNGYEVVGHRLEFTGICPNCNKSKEGELCAK